MLRHVIRLICSASCLLAQAAPFEIASPDGGVRFRLWANGEGQLVYSVHQGEQVRLQPARVGVIVDDHDLGLAIQLRERRSWRISEVFPWRGNKTLATNHCQAAEIGVQPGNNRPEWMFEVRVFDDGVGFRYRVPGNGTRRVAGESTSWQIPRDATVWFQTDTANYEGVYQSRRADEVPLEEGVKKRAVHLGPPVTIAYQDGGFGLISEAALYGYSGLTLRSQGGGRFRAAFEDDPDGWSHDGALLSPWRVIILSQNLNGLINSDLIHALCDPPDPALFPDGINTSWIQPGKGPCTWMVFGNDGAQWHRQRRFVDLTAAMGAEYLLVDAGWRTERWGWLKDGGDLWARAAELCRYAAERNVGILLWHGFPEGRDDGPSLTTVDAREEFFRNCQAAGVKGVKIDFFDSESRSMIDAYEDLLRRSAKYQLTINFHGANKPAGEARTWPHEVSREGIREQEYVLWDSLPLQHYGALPFTRIAVGHADFLPGYVQQRFLKNTTPIFQMALVVVFTSPFLCWPDNPEAYLDSPLLQFVRSVPILWDETRVLPGSKIGDTVIMARRKAADWYVAALNCRTEAQSLDLDFSALQNSGSEMTLYRDGSDRAALQIEAGLQAPADGKLRVDLQPGGGFVAHLKPPKKHPGWR